MKLRPAKERGSANYGWLEARYTFSFGEYYDPDWMGWRCLRVMNEDRIGGNTGFPSHPHREMEIVTFMLKGALSHEDSAGGSGVIRENEVQVMSAGRGIVHSEKNAENDEAHLYQVWLLPQTRGIEPTYDQRTFPEDARRGDWQLLVSGNPEDDALHICQNVRISRRKLAANERVEVSIGEGRGHWIQVIHGELQVNDQPLRTSDGIGLEETAAYTLVSHSESEILLFDLP